MKLRAPRNTHTIGMTDENFLSADLEARGSSFVGFMISLTSVQVSEIKLMPVTGRYPKDYLCYKIRSCYLQTSVSAVTVSIQICRQDRRQLS